MPVFLAISYLLACCAPVEGTREVMGLHEARIDRSEWGVAHAAGIPPREVQLLVEHFEAVQLLLRLLPLHLGELRVVVGVLAVAVARPLRGLRQRQRDED